MRRAIFLAACLAVGLFAALAITRPPAQTVTDTVTVATPAPKAKVVTVKAKPIKCPKPAPKKKGAR